MEKDPPKVTQQVKAFPPPGKHQNMGSANQGLPTGLLRDSADKVLLAQGMPIHLCIVSAAFTLQ